MVICAKQHASPEKAADMPRSFLAHFSDEKCWRLTAFLAEANKIDLSRSPPSLEDGEDTLLVSGRIQAHRGDIGI